MKKTIWQPLVIGLVCGALAGIAIVTGLSFLTPGVTDNTIGFYGSLLLLAAALGGPLAGAIATLILVIVSTLFGPPDMAAILSDPINFWSNLLAVGTTVILVGFAYRIIFERLKMPVRLLAWAGIVIAYYVILIPASLFPQYFLSGEPLSEIPSAIQYGYKIYAPQAIFDIVITSLVFVALPSAHLHPLWYESKNTPEQIR